MGSIVSISNTRTRHVLSKNAGVLYEIGSVSNYTRVSQDLYVRQHYYDQESKMVLPVINKVEFDGLRLITTDETTNAPFRLRGEITAPTRGHVSTRQMTVTRTRDNGAEYEEIVTVRVEAPGAFAYYGSDESKAAQAQLISFTNRGNFRSGANSYGSGVGIGLENERLLYFYPKNGTTTRYDDTALESLLHHLPPEGFNVYDLAVINSEHSAPAFYHVSLLREQEFVFRREIYPPLQVHRVSSGFQSVTETKSTVDFIGDAAPQFFYLDGFAYRPFPKTRPETNVLYRPTLCDDEDIQDRPHNSVLPTGTRMPMMYSYTHQPVKTLGIAANLSFRPGSDTRPDPA